MMGVSGTKSGFMIKSVYALCRSPILYNLQLGLKVTHLTWYNAKEMSF